MEYYLGIDIGTTSVKTIAFTANGKVLQKENLSYPLHHPYPEWSEQDPEEIANAVFRSIENILKELHPHLPALCSFSAAMHSLIAVDEMGHAISPSIIWADNRAADFAKKLQMENKALKYYTLTGVPVHAMSPFCKLNWFKQNQPELFQRTYKFIGIKEFIFYKLFGVYAIDISIASATGLMNLEKRQWDYSILHEMGMEAERLSEIVSIDRIFNAPAMFPILKNTSFVIGGSDGAMANLGTTTETGSLVITVGTSSAARLIVNKPQIDPAMRTFCYYLKNQTWLVGGASNNGGIVLQWLQENLFQEKENVADFLNRAVHSSSGAQGLIFLPYLLGERAPIWNARAKGILFGLQINHSKADMIMASMEGVVYCLYAISQAILEKEEIKRIYASGGFAQNEMWLQILSDVFNLPVMICETIENSAWGAVKSGMLALDLKITDEARITKTYYPDSSAHKIYTKGFNQFTKLYELLKEAF